MAEPGSAIFVQTVAPADQPNSLSTLFDACAASDRAVVESCWRVCRASMLAPSSLVSAKVRLSEPVCSVLIVALVKSWRICTTDRLEPNEAACERRLLRAEGRLPSAVLMSLLVWNVWVAAETPRPGEL